MCNKNHVHNLKNCSFTQKGENHLNLSSAFLMQQSRTMPAKNAWKNCIFFCLGPLLHCIPKIVLKIASKKSHFPNYLKLQFFALITTKMKLLGHFQTLWTLLQSHEAMNLTLVQFFGKRVRILWPLKKTLFSDFRLCWWSNNKKKSLKKLKTLRN